MINKELLCNKRGVLDSALIFIFLFTDKGLPAKEMRKEFESNILFDCRRSSFAKRMIGNTPAARVNLPHRADDNNKTRFPNTPARRRGKKRKQTDRCGDGKKFLP